MPWCCWLVDVFAASFRMTSTSTSSSRIDRLGCDSKGFGLTRMDPVKQFFLSLLPLFGSPTVLNTIELLKMHEKLKLCVCIPAVKS